MNFFEKKVINKFLPAILKFPKNVDIVEDWQFKFASKLFKDYIS